MSVQDAKLDMILKMKIAECVIDKVSMIRKIIFLKYVLTHIFLQRIMGLSPNLGMLALFVLL